MNCLFCNFKLDCSGICSDTNHYFYINLDKNVYTISFLVKEDIELLLHGIKGAYRFLILNNTDCRENQKSIFDFDLNEEDYFKINNLDINKIKNHLEKLYELTIFI